jgi:hypothetical protein
MLSALTRREILKKITNYLMVFFLIPFFYQKGHGRKGRWHEREDGGPDELT